jgi:hypothetical protein
VTYSAFRSTMSGFTPSSNNQIASGVTGASFSDTGLMCATAFFYVAEATNAGYASGGSTISHSNIIDLSGVTNPAPMAVYQTACVGNFTYTISGFTAGSSHTVRLHFAETYFSPPVPESSTLKINGPQVSTNFDIFATAGAKNKAIIEPFTVNANSSGQYVVQFTSVVNQSLLSGIEVE